MKKRKRISSTTAIMLRVIALVLALWLVGMYHLTVITAEEIRSFWVSYVKFNSYEIVNSYAEYDDLRNSHFSSIPETGYLDNFLINNMIDLSFCEAGSLALEWNNEFVESALYPSKGTPVTYYGTTYPNLEILLRSEVPSWIDGNLWEFTYLSENYYMEGYDDVGFFNETVVHGYPLKAAMWELLPTYLLTFTVLAGLIAILWWSLRKRQKKTLLPVESSTVSTDNPDSDHQWSSIEDLPDFYAHTQQLTHQLQQEKHRLATALDYEKDAEIRRRELVANITHELKTPLAVIHSHAEGLQEGIATHKKDQYLSIILDEAQRMDEMVLEMLDLSRLEAGQVQLSADQICLSDLTKQIFGKFDPLLKEKELTVQYPLDAPFKITGDESRIAQVITNFASNAIKYSPKGGKISISIGQNGTEIFFRIENQCDPLSQEALERIWDSFYRAEASRTTKGTGLGLKIAKTIIELHGGTCGASNTSTGVVFHFTLP